MPTEFGGFCAEHVRVPALITKPCSEFFKHRKLLLWFIADFVTMSENEDRVHEIATKALLEVTDEPSKRKEYEDQLNLPRRGQQRLQSFRALILEILLTKSVDNFLAYISHLLAVIFQIRPEMLRSDEKIKMEDVLKFGSMDELVEGLAERRVETLSYRGMADLNSYLLDNFGFPLFPVSDPLQRAVRIVEERNLLVHNRGVVNRTFERKTRGSSLPLGSRLRFNSGGVFSDEDFLARSVVDVDKRAAEKFTLPVVQSPTD